MRCSKLLSYSLLLILLAYGGCARAARDTSGFAMVDSIVADALQEQVWQAARDVLREMNFDIYTRDKRGVFVAYSEVKRHRLVPHRTKYTLTLEPLTSVVTRRVTIETVDQVHGVTLLTYPGWHDRKTTDNSRAIQVLEALRARLEAAPDTSQQDA